MRILGWHMIDFGPNFACLYHVGILSVLRRCALVFSASCAGLSYANAAEGTTGDVEFCPIGHYLGRDISQTVNAGGRVFRTCWGMTLKSGQQVSVPIIINPEVVSDLEWKDVAYLATFISNRHPSRRTELDQLREAWGNRVSMGVVEFEGHPYQVWSAPGSYRSELVAVDDAFRLAVTFQEPVSDPIAINSEKIARISISFFWHTGWVVGALDDRKALGNDRAPLKTALNKYDIRSVVADMKRVVEYADITDGASK